MNIEIKARFGGAVLFEDDAEAMKIAVEAAIKAGAKLDEANLARANLAGANLDGEIITKETISITNMRWPVLITGRFMRIGCQRHDHESWIKFTDDEIVSMDGGALEFWIKWKIALLALCNQCHD